MHRYIPGHIHAFYILYVYYSRQERAAAADRAPGIYSERVQTGGKGYAPPAAGGGYGTINNNQAPPPPY